MQYCQIAFTWTPLVYWFWIGFWKIWRLLYYTWWNRSLLMRDNLNQISISFRLVLWFSYSHWWLSRPTSLSILLLLGYSVDLSCCFCRMILSRCHCSLELTLKITFQSFTWITHRWCYSLFIVAIALIWNFNVIVHCLFLFFWWSRRLLRPLICDLVNWDIDNLILTNFHHFFRQSISSILMILRVRLMLRRTCFFKWDSFSYILHFRCRVLSTILHSFKSQTNLMRPIILYF